MAIERLFSVFRTAAKGLEAQRIILGTAAENIANANTSRTASGQPYQLKRTRIQAPDDRYVRFAQMLSQMKSRIQTGAPGHIEGPSLLRLIEKEDLGPRAEVTTVERYRMEYDPTHPDADAQGYVRYPDVNVAEEMARMISANRLYEANLSTVAAAKEMFKRAMEI